MDSGSVLDGSHGSSAVGPRLTVSRVAAGAALIALAYLVLRRLHEHVLIDYEVYRWAHQSWMAGEPITGGRVTTSIGLELPWLYPPFAVLALAPFTALEYGTGAAQLHIVSAAALWITIWLVVDRAGSGWNSRQRVVFSAALAAAALLVLEPVRASIGLGQVNLLLMGLVAVDVLSRRTAWPRGLLLGLAIGIKLTPAVFLVMLVLRRDFRTAATAAGVAALTVGVGFAVAARDSFAYWWTVGPASEAFDSPFVTNQSLGGALFRLGMEPNVTVRLVITALVLLAMVVIVRRADLTVALLSTAAVGLILSPTSWTDHWVWVAPVLALFVVRRHRPDGLLHPLGWVVLAVFALTPPQSLPTGDSAEMHWSFLEHTFGNLYLITALIGLLIVAWRCRRTDGALPEHRSAGLGHDGPTAGTAASDTAAARRRS